MPISEKEMCEHVRKMCEADSYTNVAKSLDCSIQLVSDIANGRRAVSRKIAEQLGFTRTVTRKVTRTFVPIKPEPDQKAA